MCTVTIRGIPVTFPFEPYDLQKIYMVKVIECLQNDNNAVLESPTGTGKTLSLLCASLAWLEFKKKELKSQCQKMLFEENSFGNSCLNPIDTRLQKMTGSSFLGLPKIIYASRTHSQLAQAVQELKRTAYKYMKAYVFGSREHMCIHPELLNESSNTVKHQMCQLKVKSRSCTYYNRVEQKKIDPALTEMNIIDIEDMIKLGKCHKFCPYYMVRELKQDADILFIPYNYLLDPLAQKALGVDLSNNVVILDEAHNIERICEESASLVLKISDVALAIEEVTSVMKILSSEPLDFNENPKEFSTDDLCILKQMLLDLEKEMDDIQLKTDEATFDGNYIFELLSKAGINDNNCRTVMNLLTNISQFLNVINGSFARRTTGLQLFENFLTIVFIGTSEDFKKKVKKCYKVHIVEEKCKKKKPDNWLSKATASKSTERILSYWCLSPGFGMNMFMGKGLKCVILTSGTLAPLKPLITELAINIPVFLENPHIVKGDQVCVKIISSGPDQETFNCSYRNRSNTKYIASVGRSVLNLVRVIPNGLLIFFPSYPIMLNFQQFWQETGLWKSIDDQKTIYVEPKDKNTFTVTMNEYYTKIKDTGSKGAIFMGVCRGKVSEGLDFADANGRAVIIIGLPYPPLKDPKVILKKQYLDVCNVENREYLKGNDWYSLEATRAVNQAIGRVIRHCNDYGAIILLDERFKSFNVRNQLSMWLRNHIKVVNNFGEIMRDLKSFFRNAETNFPLRSALLPNTEEISFDKPNTYKRSNFDFSTSSIASCSATKPPEVVVHKRTSKDDLHYPIKRKKINLIPNISNDEDKPNTDPKEYIMMIKKVLDSASVTNFVGALKLYRDNSDFNHFINSIHDIFKAREHLKHLILGLDPYIRNCHKDDYNKYCESIK